MNAESQVAYNSRIPSSAKVFPFIDAYFAENRRIPTCRELARKFHWSSHNNAAKLYRSMVRAGLLVRIILPGGGVLLVPAGRRVSNKRGKSSASLKKPPQGRKRKVQRNQQDTEVLAEFTEYTLSDAQDMVVVHSSEQ